MLFALENVSGVFHGPTLASGAARDSGPMHLAKFRLSCRPVRLFRRQTQNGKLVTVAAVVANRAPRTCGSKFWSPPILADTEHSYRNMLRKQRAFHRGVRGQRAARTYSRRASTLY